MVKTVRGNNIGYRQKVHPKDKVLERGVSRGTHSLPVDISIVCSHLQTPVPHAPHTDITGVGWVLTYCPFLFSAELV